MYKRRLTLSTSRSEIIAQNIEITSVPRPAICRVIALLLAVVWLAGCNTASRTNASRLSPDYVQVDQELERSSYITSRPIVFIVWADGNVVISEGNSPQDLRYFIIPTDVAAEIILNAKKIMDSEISNRGSRHLLPPSSGCFRLKVRLLEQSDFIKWASSHGFSYSDNLDSFVASSIAKIEKESVPATGQSMAIARARMRRMQN